MLIVFENKGRGVIFDPFNSTNFDQNGRRKYETVEDH